MRPHVSPYLTSSRVDRLPAASLAEPYWGPTAFLRDLELRLGLPSIDTPDVTRKQAYAARLAALLSSAGPTPFFARSFDLDPQGTASTLLDWRDGLVEAGWDRTLIRDSGPRVDAIVAAELLPGEPLPPGLVDRLARVELEIGDASAPLYDAIILLEPEDAWTESWRRILRTIALTGTRVENAPRAATRSPSRTATSDLATAQRLVLERAERPASCTWRGDGSLVLLHARTSWELGEAVVGLLRAHASRDAVTARLGDVAPLEAALSRQGLALQGRTEASSLRGPLPVLSLAMALLFAPRDPYRALELLTLPGGPIPPYAARRLADAIAGAPGIGSRLWLAAKAELAIPKDASNPQHVSAAAASNDLITAWFEGPGFERTGGAPKEAVQGAIARVSAWAAKRGAVSGEPVYAQIVGAAAELSALVNAHPAPTLTPHFLDLYATRAIGSGLTHDVSHEEAGRLSHVEGPHALRAAHDVVVVWHAGYDPQSAVGRLPWRASERIALEKQGLRVPDHESQLRADARAWRSVLGAAKQTFVVATPDVHLSAPQANLPLWDEIVARSAAAPEDVHLVRATPRALLTRARPCVALPTSIAAKLDPLDLPTASRLWHVDGGALRGGMARVTKLSPSSLEPLLTCPLRWVLEYVLGIRPGRLSRVPDEEQLYGMLGHRLAEDLHSRHVLASPEAVAEQAPALLASLIDSEGGPLLMPGRAGERQQVRERLLRSVERLSRFIRENDLRPTEVEADTKTTWNGRTIVGRMDLVLERDTGEEVIVDLKWGAARYRDYLRKGLALQLATYASTRAEETQANAPIPAVYFSLKGASATSLADDGFRAAKRVRGPSLQETWERAEAALTAALGRLEAGDIHVSALADDAETFLDHHGLSQTDSRPLYDPPAASACTYCANAVICGRAWSGA